MPNSILCNILRTHPKDALQLKDFYETLLGMKYSEIESKTTRHMFVFDHQKPATGVCFEECTDSFETNPSQSGYWKIGFTLHDVDEALKVIHKNTVEKRRGSQFEKIGYVSHVCDPLGYTIELLQHSFEENFQALKGVERAFLGQPHSTPVMFGQITIRCKDAESSCDFYSKVLGMKLMSIQPSINYPFTLYFFAYTDLNPPNTDDLRAIENREWLWQQSFAQIELQHRHNNTGEFFYITNDKHGLIGHKGFQISVSKDRFESIRALDGKNINERNSMLIISDPNGYQIEVLCE
uniref:Glyoxalase/fosfomycin resistance/dioxygenase domain-containing protein n=1 Tax=Clytia hemisphaerica TaxID=252671 RepID=A0A7M5XIT5_9CNID